MDLKNKINKIVSLFLFTQAAYIGYLLFSSLNVFTSSLLFFIPVGILFINAILLIIASVGLLLNKKRWPIILYWITIILPALLPLLRINILHNYLLIIINVALATYLSTRFFVVPQLRSDHSEMPNTEYPVMPSQEKITKSQKINKSELRDTLSEIANEEWDDKKDNWKQTRKDKIIKTVFIAILIPLIFIFILTLLFSQHMGFFFWKIFGFL